MNELSRVTEILAEKLGVERQELLPELSLDMLVLDSLDYLELVVALEEAFDISIPDAAFAACDTLNEIAEMVGRELRQ